MQLWSDLSSISGLRGETNKGWWVLITNNLERLDKIGVGKLLILEINKTRIEDYNHHRVTDQYLKCCKRCCMGFKCLATLLINRKKLHISLHQLWPLIAWKEGTPIWEAQTTKRLSFTDTMFWIIRRLEQTLAGKRATVILVCLISFDTWTVYNDVTSNKFP